MYSRRVVWHDKGVVGFNWRLNGLSAVLQGVYKDVYMNKQTTSHILFSCLVHKIPTETQIDMLAHPPQGLFLSVYSWTFELLPQPPKKVLFRA